MPQDPNCFFVSVCVQEKVASIACWGQLPPVLVGHTKQVVLQVRGSGVKKALQGRQPGMLWLCPGRPTGTAPSPRPPYATSQRLCIVETLHSLPLCDQVAKNVYL